MKDVFVLDDPDTRDRYYFTEYEIADKAREILNVGKESLKHYNSYEFLDEVVTQRKKTLVETAYNKLTEAEREAVDLTLPGE